MAGAAALRVVDLTFRYGRKPPTLEGISFRAHGGVYTIRGSNGSGKTTLLRLIATAKVPNPRQVFVDEQDLSRRQERVLARAKINYLPQVTRSDSTLTVRNWIEFGGWLQRLPGGELKKLTSRAISEWQLENLSAKRLNTLSVGQRRRADLARACMNPNATLIVLDEPFAALDRDFTDLAKQVLVDRSSSATVVYSDPGSSWDLAATALEL